MAQQRRGQSGFVFCQLSEIRADQMFPIMFRLPIQSWDATTRNNLSHLEIMQSDSGTNCFLLFYCFLFTGLNSYWSETSWNYPDLIYLHWSYSTWFSTQWNFFLATPSSMVLLVLWPGIKPKAPAVELQSLNHWTAKEVPSAQWISTDTLLIANLKVL